MQVAAAHSRSFDLEDHFSVTGRRICDLDQGCAPIPWKYEPFHDLISERINFPPRLALAGQFPNTDDRRRNGHVPPTSEGHLSCVQNLQREEERVCAEIPDLSMMATS